MKKKKIAVAMSGGMDSTFVALLLKKQGYYIEGFTLKMLDYESDSEKSCCSLTAIDRAKQICHKLDIKHTTLEITDLFKNTIIQNFVDTYKQARTPNPCILCNRYIKFGYLLDRTIDLGFDYLATGHYAQLKYNWLTRAYCLYKNKDSKKDQSYFLSTLTQNQLKYIRFPLSKYNKQKVKEELLKYDVMPEKLRESQDVCFLGNYSDYREFLKLYLKENEIRTGKFITEQGVVLGEHQGLPFYTIGQRRGLNISYSEPLYVKELNIKDNTIILGTKQALLKSSFYVNSLNLQCKIKNKAIISVKIRYQFKPQKAKIIFLDNDMAKLQFLNYKTDITPGQQAVFYKKNKLLGSGTIIKNKVS